MKVLEAFDLGFQTPDGRPLIKGLSFSLNRGETLAITGPNGCGKSTLLQILMGQSKNLKSGKIKWHRPPSAIAYLPQLHSREFHIGLILHDVLSFTGEFDKHAIETSSFGLLRPSELGLAWNTASGGERQKTLLTSIFLHAPEILILDEPMNHLDSQSRQQLLHALQDFVRVRESSVIMVGHESSLEKEVPHSVHLIDMKGYSAA